MSWMQSDRPIYLQLVEKIEQRIISGFYRSGDKIPSVRELAAQFSVNPNTVQKSLSELEERGLIYAQSTSGNFITENTALLEKTKATIADSEIRRFLEKMSSFGFNKEDIMSFIGNVDKQPEAASCQSAPEPVLFEPVILEELNLEELNHEEAEIEEAGIDEECEESIGFVETVPAESVPETVVSEEAITEEAITEEVVAEEVVSGEESGQEGFGQPE